MIDSRQLAIRSRHLPVSGGGALHLTRFTPAGGATRAAVVCWPDIAATSDGFRHGHDGGDNGLAPWLARQGYDVALIDRRGHGPAWPRPARRVRFDQHDIIVEEIPTALTTWLEESGARRTHVVAHGWSGVLLASHLARMKDNRRRIASQVYLGARRRLGVDNATRRRTIDRRWVRYGRLLTALYGYLPTRRLRLGTADEYAGVYRQQLRWLQDEAWRDPRDGFDYGHALIRGGLPPTLHIAGNGDEAWGHPVDVARFRDECGPHQGEFKLLGTPSGLKHDYDHDELLDHEHCQRDVYPLIEAWLQEYER